MVLVERGGRGEQHVPALMIGASAPPSLLNSAVALSDRRDTAKEDLLVCRPTRTAAWLETDQLRAVEGQLTRPSRAATEEPRSGPLKATVPARVFT